MAKKTNVGSTAVPVRPQSNKLEHRIAVLPEHVQRRMAWLEQEATLLGDQTTGTGMATQAAYERLQAAQTDVGMADCLLGRHGQGARVVACTEAGAQGACHLGRG